MPRLIDATIDCILEEGLYRASSNRIAERAGVTWGVIQHHFGTREALLLATFQDGMQELIDTLESAVIVGDTFEQRLDSLADVIWRFYRRPRFVAYEQLTLNLLRDPTMDAATVRLVRRQQAKIGELLNGLTTQVADRDVARVLPPGALLQILRGVAIGLVLSDAAPRERRAAPDPAATEVERQVLLGALAALVRDGPKPARLAAAATTSYCAAMSAADLWVESYQGEVLGEAVFGAMAKREDDPDRRHQLEVLTLLERSTKELAEPVFEQLAISRGDTDGTLAIAAELADGLAGTSWDDFLAGLGPITTEFLAKYHQLVEQASDETERKVAEAYVAHEEALAAFARRGSAKRPARRSSSSSRCCTSRQQQSAIPNGGPPCSFAIPSTSTEHGSRRPGPRRSTSSTRRPRRCSRRSRRGHPKTSIVQCRPRIAPFPGGRRRRRRTGARCSRRWPRASSRARARWPT